MCACVRARGAGTARLPTMLRFNAERVKRRAMEDELHTLRSDCARLRAQLASRDSDIAELQSLVTSLQLQGAARGDDSSTAAIPSAAAAAAAAAPPNHAAGGRVPERTSASSAHGAEAPQTSEEHEGATPGKARPLYNNAPPETASSSPAGGKGPSTAHPLHGGRGDRQGGYGGGGSGGGGHSSPPPPPLPLSFPPAAAASPSSPPSMSRGVANATMSELESEDRNDTEATASSSLPGLARMRAEGPEDEPSHVRALSQELYSGHTSPITRCRFSSTGTNVASASTDGTVRIWTAESSTPAVRNATIYCAAQILSLAWEAKTDRLLVLGTAERGMKVWNVDSKRVVCDLSAPAAFPRVVDVACSPTDAAFVCSAASLREDGTEGANGMLNVWNMRSWKPTTTLPLGEDPPVVTSMCFNHNGKILATAATDGLIRLFDMSAGLPITGWPAHEGCAAACVRFGHDQSSLFSLGSDGRVLEWSLHNQGQVLRSRDASRYCAAGRGQVSRHEMALDNSGCSLLLTSSTPASPLYSIKTQQVQLAPPHRAPVVSVDWHPLLRAFATGSDDHSSGSTELEMFKHLWRARSFTAVHEGRPREMNQRFFAQSLYSTALSHLQAGLTPSLSLRVGVLFCLYCLYETQPLHPKSLIYISLEEVKEMRRLLTDICACHLSSAFHVMRKLVRDHVFLFGAVASDQRQAAADKARKQEDTRLKVQFARSKLLGGMPFRKHLEKSWVHQLGLADVDSICTDYEIAKHRALAYRYVEAGGCTSAAFAADEGRYLPTGVAVEARELTKLAQDWDHQKKEALHQILYSAAAADAAAAAAGTGRGSAAALPPLDGEGLDINEYDLPDAAAAAEGREGGAASFEATAADANAAFDIEGGSDDDDGMWLPTPTTEGGFGMAGGGTGMAEMPDYLDSLPDLHMAAAQEDPDPPPDD
eukprot:jgi/Mesen1/1772/ME000014S01179